MNLCDQYGEGIYADFWFYYHMDLSQILSAYKRNQGMDPSLLAALFTRLPEDSLTSALVSGGRHLFGWDGKRFILADIYDAINVNTVATGNFKKRPKVKEYPRPKVNSKRRAAERKSAESLAGKQVNIKDLYQSLMRRQQL